MDFEEIKNMYYLASKKVFFSHKGPYEWVIIHYDELTANKNIKDFIDLWIESDKCKFVHRLNFDKDFSKDPNVLNFLDN